MVMACAGDVPTLETLAAVDLIRRLLPDLRVRVVNVVDLMTLTPREEHPHVMIRKGSPSFSIRRALSSAVARDEDVRNPLAPSRIVSDAWNPACASRADSTPVEAALPLWRCLAMVASPLSDSQRPDACVPASPRAIVIARTSRRSSFPAAAAAPKVLQVPVVCQNW